MNQVVGLHSRRRILIATMSGAAGVVLGAPVLHLTGTSTQAELEDTNTLQLSNDLFVIRIPGEANVVAQIGADGTLTTRL